MNAPAPSFARTKWWTCPTWSSIAYYFIRHIGRLGRVGDDKEWVRHLVEIFRADRTRSAAQRREIQRIGRKLADTGMGEAFDTVYRLQGVLAARRYARAAIKPPPPTVEQLAARRQKAAERRVARARVILGKHERAVVREERAVVRWRLRVRALERQYDAARAKGGFPGHAPVLGHPGAGKRSRVA